MLRLDPHPLLELSAFTTAFPCPLGELPAPPELVARLSLAAPAPLHADDLVRAAVRDLLRAGGFKPTGRSKPASEYLLRAISEGTLDPINGAVCACNVASLHSGLPISVVDSELARGPFRVGLPPSGTTYIFNASGQVIDIGGLLSLWDLEGPCAGPVKDSQRTKTHAGTRNTLSLIWGSRALPGRAAATATFYRELLHELGAHTHELVPS